MFNEQELQEAVDKLWEGSSNLLVKPHEVLSSIQRNPSSIETIVEELYYGEEDNQALVFFKIKFYSVARHLLIEAYKQEQVDKHLREQEYSQNRM